MPVKTIKIYAHVFKIFNEGAVRIDEVKAERQPSLADQKALIAEALYDLEHKHEVAKLQSASNTRRRVRS